MRFETKVYAMSSGEFVFYDIPADVQRMLINAKESLQANRRNSKTGLHVHNMADGIKAIKAAIEALLEEVVTEELVLRYNYTATCHYYIGANGKLYENGAVLPDGEVGPGAVGRRVRRFCAAAARPIRGGVRWRRR